MAPKLDLAEIQKVKDLAAQGLSSREIVERVKFGRTKVWLILNPEKQKAQNKHNKELREKGGQNYASNQLKYHKENRTYYRLLSAKRHKRIREEYKALTKEEQSQIDEIYLMRYRLEEEWNCPCHVDHIIPLKLGGRHHPSNLQVLTACDNMKKKTRVRKIF